MPDSETTPAEAAEVTSSTESQAVESKAPDIAKIAASLIAKQGGADSAVRLLLGETHQYRDQLREVKSKLPPEGSVVLTGDDAKAWEAYKSVGKPEDVRRIKAERDQFATDNGGLRRNEELRSVADAAKVSLAVLRTIAGDRTFEVKPVKDVRTGKDVPTVFVKDGDAEAVEFDEFAGKAWKDFLPALRPDARGPIGTPRIDRDVATTPKPEETRKRHHVPLVR